ncbi:MAG: cupredoxin domain-containing protein [Patescibacteria group bacterium]|jgi:plastocyanin
MDHRWLLIVIFVPLVGMGCLNNDSESSEEEIAIISEEETTAYVDMWVENDGFDVTSIAVSTGQNVQIAFTSVVGFHTFVIDELDLRTEIVEGQSIFFRAPETPGIYRYYSDVDPEGSGFEGEIQVK